MYSGTKSKCSVVDAVFSMKFGKVINATKHLLCAPNCGRSGE